MFEKIQAYLASQLDIPADEITRDTTFESLGVDSLDTVEMVMDLVPSHGAICSVCGARLTALTCIPALRRRRWPKHVL